MYKTPQKPHQRTQRGVSEEGGGTSATPNYPPPTPQHLSSRTNAKSFGRRTSACHAPHTPELRRRKNDPRPRSDSTVFVFVFGLRESTSGFRCGTPTSTTSSTSTLIGELAGMTTREQREVACGVEMLFPPQVERARRQLPVRSNRALCVLWAIATAILVTVVQKTFRHLDIYGTPATASTSLCVVLPLIH